MEAFLSTLASVSVTVLSLLAASYAAYAVFFNQQAAKFDDLIAEDKVTIRDRLFTMGIHWGGSLAFFINPEFKDKYRARLGGLAGAAFVNRAATDVVFGSEELQQTLAEVTATDTMPGPQKGRFYLWALNETVAFATRGANQSQGQTELYPWNAGGPGFDEWRKDFDGVGQAFGLLGLLRQTMLEDFGQFLATRPEQQRNNLAPFAQTAVTSVFTDVESIRNTLKDIDKQSLLKRPYSLSHRTHGLWILVLVSLAFITGVVVPMALLATGINQSTVAGISLLAGTLAFSVGSVVLFGWDVLHKAEPPKANYARERWRAPLLQGLKDTSAKLAQGSLLNRDLFLDAKAAPESASFPVTVRKALDQYNQDTDTYNQAALIANVKLANWIRSDATLSARLLPFGTLGQSAGLTPLQTCDPQALDNVLRSLKQNPQQGISIEIQMPRWSRVIALLKPSLTVQDNDNAINRLRELGKKFEADPNKQQFDAARDRVTSSESALNAAIESWK